jgi:NAD-dependent dihydropyrimidine dehydrogenase PreA subunit
VTYTIAEPCVDIKDKSCIEECPVDCIYEGERMLYIPCSRSASISFRFARRSNRFGKACWTALQLKTDYQ